MDKQSKKIEFNSFNINIDCEPLADGKYELWENGIKTRVFEVTAAENLETLRQRRQKTI